MTTDTATDTPDDAGALGMACPKCGCRHLEVYYTRPMRNGRLRVRRCRNCRAEIRTREVITAARPGRRPPRSAPPDDD